MERLAVSTDVFVPAETVYDFLVDFPQYANYSEYLDRVRRRGDGSDGTVYDITVSWWRLSHTVRSAVTAVDPPARIDWRLQGALGAEGAWVIDQHDAVADADLGTPPANAEAATRVTLQVRYDPSTVAESRFDLPAFLSLDALVDRLVPVVQDEATAIVERIVADLEGSHRPVRLRVDTGAGDVEEYT